MAEPAGVAAVAEVTEAAEGGEEPQPKRAKVEAADNAPDAAADDGAAAAAPVGETGAEAAESGERTSEVPLAAAAPATEPLFPAARKCIDTLRCWAVVDEQMARMINPNWSASSSHMFQTLFNQPSFLDKVLKGCPNYSAMTADGCISELRELGMAGCYWFVRHSDHDGSWSTGECVDIEAWLKRLLDGSVPLDPMERAEWGDDLEEKMREFVHIFGQAVQRRTTVLMW